MTEYELLERLAERTVENREMLRQTLTQRRSTNISIYGVRFYNELLDEDNKFETHFTIMPSLDRFVRFSFMLHVQTLQSGASIDPDDFVFKIGIPNKENEEGEIDPDLGMHDITDYLQEQNNDWVDGSGFFPTMDWEDGDEVGSSYDILEVCSLLTAEDKDEWVDDILSPGVKLVRISSRTPCNIEWLPDISYTIINR